MRCLLIAAVSCALQAVPASCGSSPRAQLQHFPSLLDADLDDLVIGLNSGLFTSVDLVNAYTARILEVNSTLHVVTELNPDAISIAREADVSRAEGSIRSPLHGIPVLIKNNIATADAMTNTAGSWALAGSKVPRDSTMARKLREAGAIILGRANLSQWANFRSVNSSNGWSAHGGQTYAAYYPGQDPSGSSSGSGVASSLGLAWATLGTETSGSILSPAEVNNVVGIKPTVGLTSRYLVVPISEHQDTIGPMARTVKDAAYLLQAVAGSDPRDNYTSATPFENGLPDYVAACDYHALEGKRIGVARNVVERWKVMLEQPVLDAFEASIRHIEAAGATIVDADFTAFDEWMENWSMEVFHADFLAGIEKYLSELSYNPHGLKSVADLLYFTHHSPLEGWPDRNTKLWERSLEQGWNNTSPRFWPAYQAGLYFGDEGGVLGALERANVDAIILPTALSAPIPAIVGSPVISVPMGAFPEDWPVSLNTRGDLIASAPHVPFGLSFMGRKWSEADLIGFAYAYEQRTMHRESVEPFIMPNIELDDVVGKGILDEWSLTVYEHEQICTKEWVERCEMYADWPRIMREQGAETKKFWWTEVSKERKKAEEGEEAAADLVEET